MLDTIKTVGMGLLVFLVIVAGGTYLLQNYLWLVKLPESFPDLSKTHAIYIHWAAILIVLPFIAGTLVKMLQTPMTWLVIILGTAITVAILYPIYSGRFWAEAPTPMYLVTYCVMVMGMGYFATQPIRATFVTAFRVFQRKGGSRPAKAPSKPSAALRNRMSDTQRVSSRHHGDMVALIELLVGVVSLVLSIFSIFVLGQGG